MENSKIKRCVIAAVFAVFSFGVAVAQVPDSLKNAWENPDLREKIDAGIKANRMGMFTLKFDGNVENVKVELVRHEFLFGFYASRAACEGKVYQKNTEAEIAKFSDLARRIFNYGTIACVWRRVEPEHNKTRFNYENDANLDLSSDNNPTVNLPDIALAFCKKNGFAVKAHCLAWQISDEHFLPEWVLKGDMSEFEVEKNLNRNIKRITERYGDDIAIWDVVNEAADYVGRRDARFDDYIFKTFKEAERLLPASDIFLINETTSSWYQYVNNEQTGRFYLLCQNLIARGAKVDAIGLQFHIFSMNEWAEIVAGKRFTPRDIQKALDGYAALKRPIHVTEITIPSSGVGGEATQAYFTERVYELWFSHPSVEAITWWNMRDGQAYSKEQRFFGGLLRDDFSPKPAYAALENLIAKKWQTKKSFDGKLSQVDFSGFYGLYKLTYTVGGKTVSKDVWLGKKSSKLKKISTK